jgi:hypothetical protein
MSKIKFFSIFLLLVLVAFVIGCKSKEPAVNNQNQPSARSPTDEIKLVPSVVPPTAQEIIQLKNGYQITSQMKLVIDQRCAENGAKGGDTGNGYGCVAA